MYVGIIDQDLLNDRESFFPNLEVMKLAAYFKKKSVLFKLLLNPDDNERFSDIYIFKDKNEGETFSNVRPGTTKHFRGLAFSNNVYIPMDEEIEKSIPDFSVYEVVLRSKFGLFNEEINKNKTIFEKAAFIRMSYKGEVREENFLPTLSLKPLNGRVYIFDDVGKIDLSNEIEKIQSGKICFVRQKVWDNLPFDIFLKYASNSRLKSANFTYKIDFMREDFSALLEKPIYGRIIFYDFPLNGLNFSSCKKFEIFILFLAIQLFWKTNLRVKIISEEEKNFCETLAKSAIKWYNGYRKVEHDLAIVDFCSIEMQHRCDSFQELAIIYKDARRLAKMLDKNENQLRQEAIKQAVDNLSEQIETEIQISIDTGEFNPMIENLRNEVEKLQSMCEHQYNNNICIYCGKEESNV